MAAVFFRWFLVQFLGGPSVSWAGGRSPRTREAATTAFHRYLPIWRCAARRRASRPTKDVLDGVGEARRPFSEPSRMGPWSTNRSSWISRIVAAPPGKLTPGCVRGATSTKSPMANRGFSSGVVLGRSLPFDRYGAEAGADASSGFLSSEARPPSSAGPSCRSPRTTSGGGPASARLRPWRRRAVSAGDARWPSRPASRRPAAWAATARRARATAGWARAAAAGSPAARAWLPEPRQQARRWLQEAPRQTTTPSPRRPRARVVDPADLTEARARAATSFRRLLFRDVAGRLFQDHRRLWSLNVLQSLLVEGRREGSGKSSKSRDRPRARASTTTFRQGSCNSGAGSRPHLSER